MLEFHACDLNCPDKHIKKYHFIKDKRCKHEPKFYFGSRN